MERKKRGSENQRGLAGGEADKMGTDKQTAQQIDQKLRAI